MARTANSKQKKEPRALRLCVPVVETTAKRARGLYLRAARKHLWTELRLDYLEKPELSRLFRTLPGPVIATCRPPAEGGKWAGSEEERRQVLENVLAFGVTCVDVELLTESTWRRRIWGRRGDTRLILSWHDFAATPESRQLDDILAAMMATEADILKIVTWAREPEDNLRVLSLIPRVRSAGREIIAFCMGPLGKWSRLASPLLGGFLTFAPFTKSRASAPGQLTVNELKRLWRTLR